MIESKQFQLSWKLKEFHLLLARPSFGKGICLVAMASVLGHGVLPVKAGELSPSHGQYKGSSWTDHYCCRICRPFYVASYQANGTSSKTSFPKSSKIHLQCWCYRGRLEPKMMKWEAPLIFRCKPNCQWRKSKKCTPTNYALKWPREERISSHHSQNQWS